MLRMGKVAFSLSGKPGKWVNFISDTVMGDKLKWLLMVTQLMVTKSDLADSLGLFQDMCCLVSGIKIQSGIFNIK